MDNSNRSIFFSSTLVGKNQPPIDNTIDFQDKIAEDVVSRILENAGHNNLYKVKDLSSKQLLAHAAITLRSFNKKSIVSDIASKINKKVAFLLRHMNFSLSKNPININHDMLIKSMEIKNLLHSVISHKGSRELEKYDVLSLEKFGAFIDDIAKILETGDTTILSSEKLHFGISILEDSILTKPKEINQAKN